MSRAHLTHLADLLRGHRGRIGSRWRTLTAGRQALLALAHLRNGDTDTRLAAGFGVGVATVFRYMREAVERWRGITAVVVEVIPPGDWNVSGRKIYPRPEQPAPYPEAQDMPDRTYVTELRFTDTNGQTWRR